MVTFGGKNWPSPFLYDEVFQCSGWHIQSCLFQEMLDSHWVWMNMKLQDFHCLVLLYSMFGCADCTSSSVNLMILSCNEDRESWLSPNQLQNLPPSNLPETRREDLDLGSFHMLCSEHPMPLDTDVLWLLSLRLLGSLNIIFLECGKTQSNNHT